MKKIITVLLALVLVFSLIGCDSMVDVMGKMSKNIAGAETKVVEKSLGAAKAEPSKVVKGEDGTKTFSTKDGGTVLSVKSIKDDPEKKGYSNLSFGDGKISIPVKTDAVQNVESILVPKDLTPVIEGLKSGSKDSIEKVLMEQADEESKKAAEGTQKILSAIIGDTFEKANIEEVPEESKKDAEEFNKAVDTLNLILGNGEKKKELTQGDVVVLTALTNAVMNEDVMTIVKDIVEKDDGSPEGPEESKDPEAEKAEEAEQKRLMESMTKEILNLVDIVSVVPSEMATGLVDILGTLTSHM